ncbi:MAG: hypothetical protein ABSG69_18365, partial [Candidatus Acidiferrum sp.]
MNPIIPLTTPRLRPTAQRCITALVALLLLLMPVSGQTPNSPGLQPATKPTAAPLAYFTDQAASAGL